MLIVPKYTKIEISGKKLVEKTPIYIFSINEFERKKKEKIPKTVWCKMALAEVGVSLP